MSFYCVLHNKQDLEARCLKRTENMDFSDALSVMHNGKVLMFIVLKEQTM